MSDKSPGATNTADREIRVTRLIAAPRALVWKAWTDPQHIGQWWGPNGFTTTTHEMNVKPGGVWRFVMHGPDGIDYKNRIVFIEVVKPERLVYKHAGEEKDEGVKFHVTVTFDEQGGKTKLTLLSLFESAAERQHVIDKYGALEGAHQTVERLATYLPTMV